MDEAAYVSRWGTLAFRFWRHVRKSDSTECWLWDGAVTPDGYGRIIYLGITRLAHRVSYELHHGFIPPSPNGRKLWHICHHCDIKKCVNPAHLFLGTNQQNQADKNAKGRQAKGERHGCSKLTEERVVAIRNSNESNRLLAQQLGVNQALISMIRRGHVWKHVGGPIRTGPTRPHAKLDEAKVLEIRKRYTAGESMASIGRSLGVTRQAIRHVVSGKLWKHVC